MKTLITTIAFSNPELLDKCISSWPVHVDKCVLWQGMDTTIEPVIEKHKDKITFYMRRYNNWGFSGGCNIIMRKAFSEGYDSVVFVGSDTEMLSGFWESFLFGTAYYDFIESTHKFNCFMVKRMCFRLIGLFDENLFPAYCDDDDYRIRVCKTPMIRYKDQHGNHDLLKHFGSATVKLNQLYQFKNKKSFELNKEYMFRKWGAVEKSNPKWKPVYETPFNDKSWPLYKWVLETENRAKRLWHHIIEDEGDGKLVSLVNALKQPDKYQYTERT